MKVAVITDTNIYAIGNSFIRALKAAGHEVEVFDLHVAIKKHIKGGAIGERVHTFWPVEAWVRKGNRDLAVFLQRFKPDRIIVSGNIPVSLGVLAFYKSIAAECRSILFWPDTLTNLQQAQINAAPLYDLVASYSSAAMPVFKQMGFRDAVWMPFAGDMEFLGNQTLPELNESFQWDFTFIGGWRPEREKAVKAVLHHFPGIAMQIRGTYWMQQVSDKELKKRINGSILVGKDFGTFLKSSRINLNVIDDTNYPAANMRFFEVPASGGLQLSSSCPEMELIFKHRKHICYFKSEDELLAEVKYILEHPKEAAEIRMASYQLIHDKHSYVHRMEELLNY